MRFDLMPFLVRQTPLQNGLSPKSFKFSNEIPTVR